VSDRTAPSIFQYDYLALKTLSEDIDQSIRALPATPPGAMALDVGADKSPYRERLTERGFAVRTLDLTLDNGADYAGTAEETRLADESFDLVLCTQVLEHTREPWRAVREMARILKPGGHLIASAPHVWFYHPHPSDCWRFTQEGVAELCRQGELELIELRSQGGSVLTVFQVWNFLLYGVVGRTGAPIYAVSNLLGRTLDSLFFNELFCHNFAWIARKS
jgi:SAM-dependent methyltransferase